MPAADPLPISKINQEQDEGIRSPSKDGPCSLPTVHMISSGSLSSISHPLSALPLQFQADPEDDDYTREAKEQAAWEAAAVLEAQAASVSRDFSTMDVQHQSAKRPRSLSEDSPGREGKISAQASDLKTPALLLLTNGDPEDSDQPTRRRSSRFQSGSIPPPTSKNAIHLFRSLSCNPPSRSGGLDLHGSYRPDWSREDPATTVPQRRGAFVGLAATPAKVPTPECRVSLPFEKASESDSGTACCSASQLGEGCRAQRSAGRLFPAPTESPDCGSNERVVAREFTQQTREEAEGWDGTPRLIRKTAVRRPLLVPGGTMVAAPLPGRRAALWPGEPASCRISVQRA